MSVSAIFTTGKYKEIEAAIVELINRHSDVLSVRTAASTRAAGDAIQDILSEQFEMILGDLCAQYSSDFARRAMADLAFTDCDGLYYVVDVKSHRLGTSFNMPNLTSVERLARFYESDTDYFVVLIVKYEVEDTSIRATEAHFVPIEFLGWDCLTIGALGWGQIQIANANVITVNPGYSRKKWMLQLCDAMLEFYPSEMAKIADRMEYFERVKARWEGRTGD
ncbi:MAG: hypothetical protein NTU88_05165 [Armatimonadetes bacterium]|nr:hypothetical protein [Armatimonadota bacterium]